MSYTQHQIDLLPEAMRAKTKARIAASRNIFIAVIAAGILIGLATHARLTYGSAEADLDELMAQAKVLDDTEKQSAEMQKEIADLQLLFNRYYKAESPVPVNRILATIVYEMPDSASIDLVVIDTDQSRRERRARISALRTTEEEAPRILVAEIKGFASSDQEITRFVRNLELRKPFSNVKLDFSRQRNVKGNIAREFRLSLTVDFDTLYEIKNLAYSSTNGTLNDVE